MSRLNFPSYNWITTTIGSATQLSSAVDLQWPCEYLQIITPAMTACTLALHVSDEGGGTYQMLGEASNISGSISGTYSSTFNLGGYQFVKVYSVPAQAAERSIKVRGYS